MAIRVVHHTWTIVKDLGRSIYFYHDLLGAERDTGPSARFSGDDVAHAASQPA